MDYYGYIYKTILPDGRYYIGQRKGSPENDSYLGSGVVITQYIKKYGKQNIKKEILVFGSSKEELSILEKEFIGNLFNTDEKCLNLRAGGDLGPNLKGTRWFTDGVKNIRGFEKPEGFRKGRTLSKETKTKMCHAGRKQTKEEKQMRSKILKEYYKTHPGNTKGYKHSEEFKEKCRKRMLNNTYSRGAIRTKEFREKLSSYVKTQKKPFWMYRKNLGEIYNGCN